MSEASWIGAFLLWWISGTWFSVRVARRAFDVTLGDFMMFTVMSTFLGPLNGLLGLFVYWLNEREWRSPTILFRRKP